MVFKQFHKEFVLYIVHLFQLFIKCLYLIYPQGLVAALVLCGSGPGGRENRHQHQLECFASNKYIPNATLVLLEIW